MTDSGLFLSIPFLAKLSPATLHEILTGLGLADSAETDLDIEAEPMSFDYLADDEGAAELTPAQVRNLTEGLNPKSMGILRLIAQSETPELRMSAAIAVTDKATSYRDLSKAFGAITLRTRNVLGDPDQVLIWWNNPEYDDNGEYLDNLGRVSPMTHKSLRQYFKKNG